jgi:alginate O-acetyltransferase complex protein AlgI
MLGFEFLKNFNYPYIATSITDFWRRWHISLSTWFKEYVYIPLGGNRKGTRRQIINLLIVWGLTGLWHGAAYNFILWGLYYGLILIIEKFVLRGLIEKLPAVIRHIYTIILFLIGWVIFYFEDMGEMGAFIASMFNFSDGILGAQAGVLVMRYLAIFVIAVIACTPLAKNIYLKIRDKGFMWLPETAYCAGILTVAVAAMVQQSYNPFLYFRF